MPERAIERVDTEALWASRERCLGTEVLASCCVGVTYILCTGLRWEWDRVVLTVLLQHFPDLPPNEDTPLIVWVPRQGQRTEAEHTPSRVYR